MTSKRHFQSFSQQTFQVSVTLELPHIALLFFDWLNVIFSSFAYPKIHFNDQLVFPRITDFVTSPSLIKTVTVLLLRFLSTKYRYGFVAAQSTVLNKLLGSCDPPVFISPSDYIPSITRLP